MRISDWSSDVCSSDLRFPQFIDLVRSMLVDVDHIGAAPRHDLDKPDPREMPERLAHRRMAHSEARGDFALAQPRSGRRSEEHTSELQSLMRSSYAVLCLKKKTCIRTKSD